jgi:hypothetical protein
MAYPEPFLIKRLSPEKAHVKPDYLATI